MEAEASSAIAGVLQQLGIAGIILAVLIAGGFWYVKASKDLRDEKRGVIAELEAKYERQTEAKSKLRAEHADAMRELRERLEATQAKLSATERALLDCQYPGRTEHNL